MVERHNIVIVVDVFVAVCLKDDNALGGGEKVPRKQSSEAVALEFVYDIVAQSTIIW